MYTVDDKDSVRRLDVLPKSDTGSPLPVVVSDERTTLVAYLMWEPVEAWDGLTMASRPAGPGLEDEPFAIVRFVRELAHMFGPPNDEAFSGHPLASRGLEPYGVFEVLNSSWIRALEKMNRVHRDHRPDRYHALRHFILSFHDSTFECVAQGVEVAEIYRGSLGGVVSKMASMIANTRQ
jgi:hypothetical protein